MLLSYGTCQNDSSLFYVRSWSYNPMICQNPPTTVLDLHKLIPVPARAKAIELQATKISSHGLSLEWSSPREKPYGQAFTVYSILPRMRSMSYQTNAWAVVFSRIRGSYCRNLIQLDNVEVYKLLARQVIADQRWVYFMLPADHLYTNSNYCSTTNQLFASSIFVNGCFSYRNTVSTLGSLFPESIYRSYSGSYKSTKQLPHRRHKIHQHAVQAPRHRYADPLAGPGSDGLGLLLQELGPQQPVLAGLDSSR